MNPDPVMSDKELSIINGLISRDPQITAAFLSGCRPMLANVTEKEFSDDYNLAHATEDFLSYLLSDNAAPLIAFRDGGSKNSFRKWLRTEAIRYFEQRRRLTLIEAPSQDTLCDKTCNSSESQNKQRAEMNIAAMIDMVELERDRMVLERIDIDGGSYDELEKETGLSKANLYNIRKRALERLKTKARVALGGADNLCVVKCEQYAMEILGMHKPLYELSAISKLNGWLTDDGVSQDHMGKLSKLLGFEIKSKKGRLEDIVHALDIGEQALAVVDGGELIGNPFDEAIEDILQGERADHCVVVLNCDRNNEEIMLFDPAFGDVPLTVTISKFMDAWADSHNHYVTIGRKK